LSTGEYYGLTAADMKQIVKMAVDAVMGWRAEAAKIGFSRKEASRMAGAFEHQAHEAARAFVK
jgi:dihydrodipicolinate synthase/N-acetylneuraminate lyase